MADEKLVRVGNLRALLKARQVPERERARYLSQRLGSNVTYWSGMLAGDRSFGEKVARRIEEGLELARAALDVEGQDWTHSQHASAGRPASGVAQELSDPKPDDEPPQHTWEFILSAVTLPARFRLVVPDDALAPSTPRGTVLIFEPAAPPVFGHGVLVEDAAGQRYVRKYAQGPGGRWLAVANNAAYLTIDSADGARVLAAVTWRGTGEV